LPSPVTSALVDVEAERGLIGAAFHTPDISVTLDVRPDDFHEPLHRKLWVMAGKAVTMGATFAAGPLARQDADLRDYLEALVDMGELTKLDVRPLAFRVVDMARRRRSIAAAQEFIANAGDIEKHLEQEANALIGQMSRNVVSKKSKTKRQVAMELAGQMNEPVVLFPTGIVDLDIAIGGGLMPKKTMGIAAKTKVGKTALLGTMSHNLNKLGTRHLYCALEFSDMEIEERNVARELNINTMQFIKNREKYYMAVAEYAVNVPDNMVYEHRPGASFEEYRAMVASAKINQGITGWFLDCCQLVSQDNSKHNEEQHIRQVAQWSADYARDQDMWCVMSMQLNETGGVRGGNGPRLACDIMFYLERELTAQGAWMEMKLARGIPYVDVGSQMEPGLFLRPQGPYFVGRSDV
jgi:replicative DNA helicase